MYAIRSYYEIVEALGEAPEVPEPVAVAVLERADTELVDDRVPVPEVVPGLARPESALGFRACATFGSEHGHSVITSYSIHYTKLYDSLCSEARPAFGNSRPMPEALQPSPRAAAS